MNKGLSSLVGNVEEQHLLWSSLHYAKYPRTFQYSPSLILSLGTKLRFVFPWSSLRLQRNIRGSQELNMILDPSKKDPDLIESHVRHRLFVQCHMYLSFTLVVSVSSILQPHLEHCWQLTKSFSLILKLKIFWKLPTITKRSLNSMSHKVVIKCQSMKKFGSSVDLVKIKLYFIKPITCAGNHLIMTIYIEPMKYRAKQR